MATHLRADPLLIGCLAALIAPKIQAKLLQTPIALLLGLLCGCIYRFHQPIPWFESAIIAALILRTSYSRRLLFIALLELAPLRNSEYGPTASTFGSSSRCRQTHRNHLLCSRLASVLASSSYYIIEKPMIRFGRRVDATLYLPTNYQTTPFRAIESRNPGAHSRCARR